MENQDKKVLDLAMEAGRILLDAGAEIFRVEETMKRIAQAYGVEKFLLLRRIRKGKFMPV